MKRIRAFTLIEVVVATAILALAAVSVIPWWRAMQRAGPEQLRRAAASDALQIIDATWLERLRNRGLTTATMAVQVGERTEQWQIYMVERDAGRIGQTENDGASSNQNSGGNAAAALHWEPMIVTVELRDERDLIIASADRLMSPNVHPPSSEPLP